MQQVLTFVLSWHYRFMNSALRFAARIIYRSYTEHAEIQKILLFRKGTMGDSICAMPAVIALRRRFPEAQIHCLTNAVSDNQSGMAQLFAGNIIEQYINFSAADRNVFRQIRQERYDMVIELPQALDTCYTQIRNMFLFRLAGIRYGAGWEVSTTFWLRRLQMKYLRFEREPVRLLQLLQRYKLVLQTEECYSIEATAISSTGWGVPYIVMAVGAKMQRSRWPLTNFRLLAERVIQRTNRHVVLIGNAEDRDATQDWNMDRVFNLCGRTTLKEVSSVISKAEFYVGNDTGLMHLAAALNKPVVAIFSAKTYPNKWYPATSEQYIHADYSVPCAICSTRPCADNICMQRISVDRVWDSITQLINQHTE
jgi:ADP-heptose:LPS heptosyltransferase